MLDSGAPMTWTPLAYQGFINSLKKNVIPPGTRKEACPGREGRSMWLDLSSGSTGTDAPGNVLLVVSKTHPDGQYVNQIVSMQMP